MMKGSMWQIGNEAEIRVWQDAWIPHLEGYKLNPNNKLGVNLNVC